VNPWQAATKNRDIARLIQRTLKDANIMNIQYVTDNEGNRIAVQIPLDQWEAIKAELESYDGELETAEILVDRDLMDSIKRGREQAKRKSGRRADEIEV
jgi:hypothetical protein